MLLGEKLEILISRKQMSKTEFAEKIGIKQIYFQEKGSAESSFTPDFDLTGVEK